MKISERKYNEEYTDWTRTSRVVKSKTKEEWFEWMNERKDDFPKSSLEEVIEDLEWSIRWDLEGLDKYEYFKEEIPVKIKVIEGYVWTDHDEIRNLKNKIGHKVSELKLLKSIKHDLVK